MIQLIALLVMVMVSVAVAVLIGGPNVEDLRARFDHPGLPTALIFAALYAAVTLAPLPKAVFTIAAGMLFGVPAAVAIVLTGALVGAVAAFYLGRVLGRHAAERFVGRHLIGLDALLVRRGLWAVAGLRLIPLVPFTAMNYLSGLTALRLAPYAIGSLLGMAPGTAAYVVVGAYGAAPGSWPFLAALAGLLALTAAGVVAAARNRRLRRRTQVPDPAG